MKLEEIFNNGILKKINTINGIKFKIGKKGFEFILSKTKYENSSTKKRYYHPSANQMNMLNIKMVKGWKEKLFKYAFSPKEIELFIILGDYNNFKRSYSNYLKSIAWSDIRIEMLTAYPKCNRCDSSYSLQVHHKTYKNVFKEEPEDLEVLCKNCHKLEHKIK